MLCQDVGWTKELFGVGRLFSMSGFFPKAGIFGNFPPLCGLSLSPCTSLRNPPPHGPPSSSHPTVSFSTSPDFLPAPLLQLSTEAANRFFSSQRNPSILSLLPACEWGGCPGSQIKWMAMLAKCTIYSAGAPVKTLKFTWAGSRSKTRNPWAGALSLFHLAAVSCSLVP